MPKKEPNGRHDERAEHEDRPKPDKLARVEKLFRLATDKNANEEEARTAALACVRLMKDEELTVIPSTELETVKKKIGEMTQTMEKMKKAMDRQFMKGIGVALIGSKLLKLNF